MPSWWQREQCFSSTSKAALATGSVGTVTSAGRPATGTVSPAGAAAEADAAAGASAAGCWSAGAAAPAGLSGVSDGMSKLRASSAQPASGAAIRIAALNTRVFKIVVRPVIVASVAVIVAAADADGVVGSSSYFTIS